MQVYNVGADKAWTLNELAHEVAQVMGVPPNIKYLDQRNEVCFLLLLLFHFIPHPPILITSQIHLSLCAFLRSNMPLLIIAKCTALSESRALCRCRRVCE